MQLTSAQIKYILAVYDLQTAGPVKLTRVAENLHVSKPSAHRMLGQLKDLGMITQDKRSVSSLTDSGMEIAQRYAENFQLIHRFFIDTLHLDQGIAAENAGILLGNESSAIRELCYKIREFQKEHAAE